MKKILTMLLAVVLTAALITPLTGCGSTVSKKEVSDYLATATPESSSLAFYIYDGSTTTVRYLSDSKSTEKILSALSKVKASPVADYGVSKGAVPFYGISIGSSGSEDLNILFAGGYAILGDGRGYEFDYNFSGFENRYAWKNIEYIGGMAMPCSYFIANTQTGWQKGFLVSTDSDVNSRLVTEKTGESNTKLELKITNNLGMDWRYGEYRHLETQLDGEWFKVPAKTAYAVNDIGYELPMEESRTHSYDLSYYGDLPAGIYRLVIDGSDADAAYEFTK